MERSVKNTPVFVELIGLPGSGKTSITREVISTLKSQGLTSKTRHSVFHEQKESMFKRSVIGILFLLHQPLFTLQVFCFCLRSGISHEFFAILPIFISKKRSMRSSPDFVIYDQGVLNTLLSLGGKMIDWKKLSWLYRELLNVPINVILIQIDPHTAQQRAQHRSSRGHFTETESTEEIQRRYQTYLTQINELIATNAFNVQTIDGHQDLSINVEHLVAILKQYA